ncbi:hypothetical protein HIM_02985 [Hirsutella minnesotensis 3608]|nr:hypothetical protein HIM_02985 [Hirsutella minnesotensis 3608]
MAPPSRTSLRSFLAAARSALRAPASQRASPLTLVVGNESADLDSLCSAIVYAYLRSHSQSSSSPSAAGHIHVPLANLPRADLGLRPEMTAVLGHAGLSPADLITLSELPDGDMALRPEDTHWILVDHNALTGPLARYAPSVVGCVDHHVDEGRVPADAAPRTIEPCGSCASLVVEETKAVWDALTSRDTKGDNDLAKLAMAPILVDTINLGAPDKVKPKDTSAVGYLEAKLSRSVATFSRDDFYGQLSAVKEDISKLSFRDILRKDYKQWDESGLALGISCVTQDLAYLVDKASGHQPLLDHLSAWAAERHLDVAAVMTTSHPDGHFQRNLLVWGRSARGHAATARFVEIARGPLRLDSWRNGDLDEDGVQQGQFLRHAWRQGELTASRKQVAPLLREAIKTA